MSQANHSTKNQVSFSGVAVLLEVLPKIFSESSDSKLLNLYFSQILALITGNVFNKLSLMV